MSAPKTIVFCGTPAFAVPSLRAVSMSNTLKIVLVVTQPDKPVGRKQEYTPPPVKTAAQELALPILQPHNVNAELPAALAARPDFLVTVAYGEILNAELLAWPRIAPVNVHPSLLPRWRGAAPMQHAILAGDTMTGVTVQKMSAELDAGDILLQREVPLAERETYQTLHDRLADLAAELLVETLTRPLSPTPQSEKEATFCRKLSRENGKVDPQRMNADKIDRTVRALTPWPGVTCTVEGHEVKLHETSLVQTPQALPLHCAQGTTLFITKLQSPGKTVVTGGEWLRGNRKK